MRPMHRTIALLFRERCVPTLWGDCGTKVGRPSFLQDTTLHSHNSTHTTQHGTTPYVHNSTPHNSTRPQLDTAQLNAPQLDTPEFNTPPFDTSQLDTTQFYTTTTQHIITLHDHISTRYNSTQTTWPYA